ncbi:flagellar hook-length control protein FliK [Chitinimonas arctica]|uniref:Flagellar hook-length control protein FliK n=1 Tax=Chitinimonas arctica TaxID=2594795 RepID=A0A516SL84_9NEIS|nr:flagellar hook-length control protein FliK [Chitinimonas arctica]QDQ28919.1 flagellar hook-length control protein FliK [Chitinimonas arctica]
MIPANALVAQLQSYVKPSDLPLVQVVDAVQEIQQLFTVGEQVRATVTGQLTSGRFAVLVKEQLLDLNLPRNTQPGESFDMRVLGNTPRLTFLLPRQQGMGDVPLPPPPKDGSTAVELSETARFLGGLLAEAAEEPAQASLLTRNAALLSAGEGINTPKLADTLKQVLSESGLFYESHLAEWTDGERTLAQLLKEPPANWSDPARTGKAANSAGALPRERLDGGVGQNMQMAAGTDETEAVRTEQLAVERSLRELENMPSSARQLVQQQLQLLDQRHLVWMGQAWPGQPLRWEVEEEGRRDSEEPDAPTVWRTRLRLTLPNLGEVDVLVSLMDRKQVDVGFRVTDPETADRIRTEQHRLQAQLDAAGLQLSGNQVAVVSGKG